jgi:hypothetical protein
MLLSDKSSASEERVIKVDNSSENYDMLSLWVDLARVDCMISVRFRVLRLWRLERPRETSS